MTGYFFSLYLTQNVILYTIRESDTNVIYAFLSAALRRARSEARRECSRFCIFVSPAGSFLFFETLFFAELM